MPLPAIILLLLFELMVLAIAFVPPKHGLIGGDVTFFYATYPLVTIGLLGLCASYFAIWRYALPKLGGYVHREALYVLANGELGNTILKVKLSEVEEWDREHETSPAGRSGVVLNRESVEQSKE